MTDISNPPKSTSRPDFHELPAAERVQQRGYRRYVGGRDAEKWYSMGRHQYHYLVKHGLAPHHRLLDVACGSLRLGQWVIPMLERGNYYGLEGEPSLVAEGLAHEMMFDVAEVKAPNFAYNYTFDLTFCPVYDFAIAQSLFTHLTLSDIETCFENMITVAAPEAAFFWTFIEGDDADNPEGSSHPNRSWRYRFDQIAECAQRQGFDTTLIGDWNHPNGQLIARSTPKA